MCERDDDGGWNWLEDGGIRSEKEKERKRRKGRKGKEIGSKRSDKEKDRKGRKYGGKGWGAGPLQPA
jgi:hypothetical protein